MASTHPRDEVGRAFVVNQATVSPGAGAVALQVILAYSTGIELLVHACRRGPSEAPLRPYAEEPRDLRVSIRYDQHELTNEWPPRPVRDGDAGLHGSGSGNDVVAEFRYWLTPFPKTTDVTVDIAWPEQRVVLTIVLPLDQLVAARNDVVSL